MKDFLQSNFTRPFVIGIAGGTGSGKTTIVRKISELVPADHVTVIAHDDYYCDQSSLPISEREKTNYDHPSSFETSLLTKHLDDLLAGKSIQKPMYDFPQYTRSTQVTEVFPKQIIIVEGILVLESAELRKYFDLKIFVDTDADIRLIRRISRDIQERGRTFEFVIQQYMNTVRPMQIEFVEPSKRFADVIIPEGGQNTVALDLVLARIREIVQK